MAGLLVWAAPFAAYAQWGTTVTEHDWRFTIAGRPYGLVQEVSYVGARVAGTRRTTVYLGAYSAKTRIPAVCVATAILLPAAAMGLFVVPRFFRQEEQV